jgi:hypothetical protein
MKNVIFGELTFNTGWKTKTEITLFGKNYNVAVKAKAYFEKDGVTSEQETAYADFNAKKAEKLKTIEKLLDDFTGNSTSVSFTPRMLLFKRDGGYALLLDDKGDDGIAVCLVPKTEVVSQDEYL